MSRLRLSMAALAALALLVSGCGAGPDDAAGDSSSATGGSHSVATKFGPVRTDSAPQRIVALLPAYADTVTALGRDDSVVGIASFIPRGSQTMGPWQKTPYPAEVARLGDMFTPIDPESIAALKPDLILAGALQAPDESTYQTLSAIAPTYVSQGKTHDSDDWHDTTRAIGQLMWESPKAESVIADVDKKLATTRETNPNEVGKTFLQVNLYQGAYLIASSARSQESFMSALGLSMAQVETKNNTLSVEQTAQLDAADMLLVPSQRRQALESQPNWSSVIAVKNGAVTVLSPPLAQGFRSPSAASIPYLVDAMEPQLTRL